MHKPYPQVWVTKALYNPNSRTTKKKKSHGIRVIIFLPSGNISLKCGPSRTVHQHCDVSLLWYLTSTLCWSIIVRVCCKCKEIIRLKRLLFSVYDLLRVVVTAPHDLCFFKYLDCSLVQMLLVCQSVSISLKECRSNTPHPDSIAVLETGYTYCSLLTSPSASWHTDATAALSLIWFSARNG